MKKQFIISTVLCLLIIIISLAYGVSIQNAQDNHLLTHLYEDEGVHYSTLDEIPTLNFKAALLTSIFIVAVIVLEWIGWRQSENPLVKKLTIGAIFAGLIILLFDGLTLAYPYDFNFKNYGMIWVLLSLSIVFKNVFTFIYTYKES